MSADPFILTENLQSLGYSFVNAAGIHLDRVFHSPEIKAGNLHVFRATWSNIIFAFYSTNCTIPAKGSGSV
jgi:hypothetical protein